MSDSYTEMLRENYSNMHTDILIETKIKGGLTDVAYYLLVEELKKRGVQTSDVEEYIETEAANYKPEDFAEGIKIGDLASTGKRYLAQIVDQFIAIGLGFLAAFVFDAVGMKEIGIALFWLIYIAYILFNDGLPNGQSLGKKMLSIKVINKTNATSCSYSESFIRNITTVIPFLAIIDAVMIFGMKKQRMGDKIANTLVVNAK
jgi:uncharacterized RDD family membrane protein YckC